MILLLTKFYVNVTPLMKKILTNFCLRFFIFIKMKNRWLQNLSNKNILRFYNSQSISNNIFIFV